MPDVVFGPINPPEPSPEELQRTAKAIAEGIKRDMAEKKQLPTFRAGEPVFILDWQPGAGNPTIFKGTYVQPSGTFHQVRRAPGFLWPFEDVNRHFPAQACYRTQEDAQDAIRRIANAQIARLQLFASQPPEAAPGPHISTGADSGASGEDQATLPEPGQEPAFQGDPDEGILP